MVDGDGGTLVIERCVLVNIEIVTRVNQRTVMYGIGCALAIQRCVVILIFLFLALVNGRRIDIVLCVPALQRRVVVVLLLVGSVLGLGGIDLIGGRLGDKTLLVVCVFGSSCIDDCAVINGSPAALIDKRVAVPLNYLTVGKQKG